MALQDNNPQYRWISWKNLLITYENKIYQIQNGKTNKKYVYWNVDNPYILECFNRTQPQKVGFYQVFINDKGIGTERSHDEISLSWDGNNIDVVTEQIFGLHEENKKNGTKFMYIENDINHIKNVVGNSKEDEGSLLNQISKIEQKSDNINLSVKELEKKYDFDSETSKLREGLNKSMIDFNSSLGEFKSELYTYYKDNKISEEENKKIKANLKILQDKKDILLEYIDKTSEYMDEKGNTDEGNKIRSGREKYINSVKNLENYITTAISDSTTIPSEITMIIDLFGKCNSSIQELKNTCDDCIFLGAGGSTIEALSKLDIKKDEILLEVDRNQDKNNKEFSKLDIKTNQISMEVGSKVGDCEVISSINQTPERIKIKANRLELDGYVEIQDLKEEGKTIINGSNISTGTIDASRVNIKGGTDKKIVIANDNYCVYDGNEIDENRKIFIGFRKHSEGKTVPTVILGYNGIRPNVDGSLQSGGTYTTYSHYKNYDNPEGINQSYGALAYKYNSKSNDISTLNMYQSGDVGLQAGNSIYLRANKVEDNQYAQMSINPYSVNCNTTFNIGSGGIVMKPNGELHVDYLNYRGDGANVSGFTARNGSCSVPYAMWAREFNTIASTRISMSSMASKKIDPFENLNKFKAITTKGGKIRLYTKDVLSDEGVESNKCLTKNEINDVVCIDNSSIIANLVEAVKGLKKENKELKDEISSLINKK